MDRSGRISRFAPGPHDHELLRGGDGKSLGLGRRGRDGDELGSGVAYAMKEGGELGSVGASGVDEQGTGRRLQPVAFRRTIWVKQARQGVSAKPM
jgi:hypothetical protein